MTDQSPATTAADNQKVGRVAGDEPQHAIQIAGANLPSGEPVVVLMTGATVSILPLPLAQDVADALIKAIAGSVLAEAVTPVVPASTDNQPTSTTHGAMSPQPTASNKESANA